MRDTPRDCDVAIIGAGHNGLTAAFYLARAGLKVHLFETRRKPGGAAVTEELWPGMHFSTCAHVLHGVPGKIHRDMRLAERGLVVLPRSYFVTLNRDGTYWGPEDLERANNLSWQLTPEERAGETAYGRFRGTIGRIAARYRDRLPPALDELLRDTRDPEELEILTRAVRMRVSEIRDTMLPTPRLRDRHAWERAYISRDPLGLSFATDAMYAPDERTGEVFPAGYVRGGMGEIGRVMAEAAVEAGATIHLGAPVEGCVVEGGRVAGIRLRGGEVITSRVTLSNLDPKSTLRLLPPEAVPTHLARRVAALPTNVSCYKFLAVIKELPVWKGWEGDPLERARGGTLFTHTASEVAAAFDDLEAGRPPRAPVVSFSIPSAIDPTQAPPGYHTASLWIFPAPGTLARGQWRDIRTEVGERLIDQITAYAPNFRASISEWRLRTPEDIARMHGMTDGCIWHVQHEAQTLLGNRPLPELSAYRAHLAGLYLCGAGQHPYGEVTALPGHNAAREVLLDLDAARSPPT